jgi:hypothetical protein
MKDPERPSEKAGGKLLEFPSKIKRTPLETMAWKNQKEKREGLREIGLRLLQLWENDRASESKIEAPEEWESRAQALERECNWLVLMAHCAQGLKLKITPIPLMAHAVADGAYGYVKLLIQELGPHEPRLANKLSAIINSLAETIKNCES